MYCDPKVTVFKGGNFSSEETIQVRKLFKQGNYSRAETRIYGIISARVESLKQHSSHYLLAKSQIKNCICRDFN